MTYFALYLIALSAIDGSVISERQVSEPMSVEDCMKAQVGRVSHATDGVVHVYECRRSEVV